MERKLRPPASVFQNTDGEPLAFHRLTFRIDDAVQAFEALHSLDPTSSRKDLLRNARLDRQGALAAVELAWLRPGNRKLPSWNNTVLGQLRIEGTTLVAEVNSAKRAKGIRAEIERRLGSGATFEHTVVTSIEKMLEEAKRRPSRDRERERERASMEEEEILSNPEIREQLVHTLDEHYERWVDDKLPALEGQTPRQAVKTAAGRAKVEALLAGMGRRRASGSLDLRPPVARIRKKLGLT